MENVKLAESAAGALASYISDLSPGDKLPNEHRLAECLGVGRSTVREAVKVLAAQKVLDVRQGAGTFVIRTEPAGTEDLPGIESAASRGRLLMDLLEVCLTFEPRVAALAVLRASAEEVAEMHIHCAEAEKLIHEDWDCTRHDSTLYKKIAKSSRNLAFARLVPLIRNEAARFINTAHHEPKEETITGRRRIVDAMTLHNSTGAAA
ncbi:MAG: GntR family transcriptional regulator [Treponema sp.]|nr:GntR family transcriptional regulator [Treponema sp.]